MLDQDRIPLIERSHNGRSLRSTGLTTTLGRAQPRQRTKKPPGVLRKGEIPGGEVSDEVVSDIEPVDGIPVEAFSSGNISFGINRSNSSSVPRSDIPTISAYTPVTVPAFQIEEKVEQPILLAGPSPRSRRGRKLIPTVATKVSAEHIDYLTPLTDIDEVVSKVEEIGTWCLEWTRNCSVTKIAEGSFGSILRLQNKTEPTQFTIGKLMPLRPKKGPGSKTTSFTRVQDAASEAEMLITMSNYQGFAEFRKAEVLHGQLPPSLRVEYKRFDVKHASELKSTAKFGDNQLWLFLEMSYAGMDLEEVLRTKSGVEESLSIRKTWDIFWAVALALARGEAEFRFEHRDLQVQNICIKRDSGFIENTQEDANRMGIRRYTDIEVTIIDYTLSRATLQDSRMIFNSMDDEAIFSGQSDNPDEALQYETYRSMRQMVKTASLAPARGKKNSVRWETSVPATNVLWLSYLLAVLLRHTAKGDGHDASLAGQEDGKAWSDLERLREKLGCGYPEPEAFHSAGDLVVRARCVSGNSSSSVGSAEDGDVQEGDDTKDEDSDGPVIHRRSSRATDLEGGAAAKCVGVR